MNHVMLLLNHKINIWTKLTNARINSLVYEDSDEVAQTLFIIAIDGVSYIREIEEAITILENHNDRTKPT